MTTVSLAQRGGTKFPLKFFLFIVLIGLVLSVIEIPQKVQSDIEIKNIHDAMSALERAVYSAHFNSQKHSKDNPSPDGIYKMLVTQACKPIEIYDCQMWNHRVKFVCELTPVIDIGLSVGLDGVEVPLAVTAFPAVHPYWHTLGVNGCEQVGLIQ